MPDPSSAEAAAFTNAATATDSISDDANDDVALDRIVVEAMENGRDRVMILQFESQIEAFVKDDTRTRLSFPPMSSYHRLILHRVAQFYKVDHPSQLLPDGKRQILLVKQSFSRIPRIRICDMDASTISPITSSSTNQVQVSAPPMRIMRRAPVESKPEQSQSTGLTESECSLQVCTPFQMTFLVLTGLSLVKKRTRKPERNCSNLTSRLKAILPLQIWSTRTQKASISNLMNTISIGETWVCIAVHRTTRHLCTTLAKLLYHNDSSLIGRIVVQASLLWLKVLLL